MPYEDILAGTRSLLQHSPWARNLDPSRLVALGASFGGYMINWIAGHQSQQEYRFQALVMHDGMFDTRAFYYNTEELYFPEHDMPGVPWLQPENYERYNPATPELLATWDTPMLVVHGGLDFRVDLHHGLAAFTTLQRRGIPSKMLYFPHEAHQVFNVRNQIEWHRQALGWIGHWSGTPYTSEAGVGGDESQSASSSSPVDDEQVSVAVDAAEELQQWPVEPAAIVVGRRMNTLH